MVMNGWAVVITNRVQIRNLINIINSNYTKKQYGPTDMEEAERLYRECQFQQSLEFLASLSPLAKHKALIYRLRAKIYIETNKLDLALAAINSYIRKLPSKSDGYTIKARIYIMTGKFRQALYQLEKSGGDDLVEEYYLKAYALTKLNKLQEAIDQYEKCLSKSQNYNPLIFIGKAETFIRMGQIPLSKKYLQYARKALTDGNSDKLILKTDKNRLCLCFEKYDELHGLLNGVIITKPKLEKKIKKTRLKVDKDFCGKINETVFLRNQSIVQAVTKKYKKLIDNEYDPDDADTNDTVSIFSCCFSQNEHTC